MDHIKLQTRDSGTSLKPQWQGFNLPVLRAQSRLQFETVTRRATISGAPVWAPGLVQDAGWWVQSPDSASSLAYWLAQQVAKPLPVVEGVRIVADARLQLGDKIQVTDSHKTGVTITGVITAIKHRVVHGQHQMEVRLLVVSVFADKPTLAEYDAMWGGADLQARDNTWQDATLAQFDADPLKR